MKIAVGSDHGGFTLKNSIVKTLQENGYVVEDLGTYSGESCDYPDIAFKVAEAVADNSFDRGILICGTGLGMAIAANKVKGIRAVTCSETFSARMSVEHNNANILTLGERTLGIEIAKEIVETWLSATFQGNRHERRVHKIDAYQDQEKKTKNPCLIK